MDLATTIQNKVSLSNITKNVESKIGERCIRKTIDGENWFIVDDNHLFQLKCLLDEHKSCLVVRRAKSAEETQSAEDGEHFYPADYQTVDSLIHAILKEVWNVKIA